MSAAKQRIAILGGGQAALTTALQLTDPANPDHDRYDVTVYQVGWRLGGKGATGRPADEPPRILEHGLHEWFGFYENAFRQIRGVYKELDRPAKAPLATWDAASTGIDTGFLVEWCEGRPLFWQTNYVPHGGEPGAPGAPVLSFEHVIEEAIRALERAIAGSAHAHMAIPALLEIEGAPPADGAAAPATRLFGRAYAALAALPQADLDDDVLRRLGVPAWILSIADRGLRTASALLWVLVDALWAVVRHDIDTVAHTADRRLWIQAAFTYAGIAGAARDGVVTNGFHVINDRDLRAWLTTSHYDDGGVLLGSPVVEAVYQGCFAYPDGSATGTPAPYPDTEDMEAGTALRGIVRTLFGYRGSLVYRFAAGTGDTCYAPTYEVLRARGVRFSFFSRVRTIELDADGSVARVRIGQQAQMTARGVPYDPLIDVEGLPCWPLTPRWAQLVDGETLEGQGADFEWPSPELLAQETEVVLEQSTHFDGVVLGISIAALGDMCGELVDRYDAWAQALTEVRTVRTQSVQLWLSEDAMALGFPVAEPQLTPWRWSTANPLNVFGDFSELIPMEHWPADGDQPALLAYFTSTMPGDHEYEDQADADRAGRAAAEAMLTGGLPVLFRNIVDDKGDFRWNALTVHGTLDLEGPARMDAQWVRTNVLPSERYVLSVTGSSRFRLPVHAPDAGSGPANLYLAGDWTECTLNCGCMEAATISGMLCANAISGYPARRDIVGVDF